MRVKPGPKGWATYQKMMGGRLEKMAQRGRTSPQLSRMARRVAANHPGWGARRVVRRSQANIRNRSMRRFQEKGRIIAGSGAREPGRPPFPGGKIREQYSGPGSQYGGLDDIVNFLSRDQGINQSQFDRMAQGYTGMNGSIGGARGLFAGLSPHAMNFLTTSGLLQQQAPQLDPTEGLEGDALFRAQLLNTLRGQQSPTYKLAGGVDEGFLGQVLGMIPGGHSAYAKGFNATGRAPLPPRPFRPPTFPR